MQSQIQPRVRGLAHSCARNNGMQYAASREQCIRGGIRSYGSRVDLTQLAPLHTRSSKCRREIEQCMQLAAIRPRTTRIFVLYRPAMPFFLFFFFLI